MDFDYRNRTASPCRPAIGGSYMYPRVGGAAPSPAGRGPPYYQPAPHASPGLGIRVLLKPEFCMNLSPQLAPQIADVPRCTFQFDFDFERKILAEAEKESPNWIKIVLERQSSKIPSLTPSSTGDPVVDTCVSEGLPREATSLGVLNYGDNPEKVREFVKGYNLLREMGFASKNVAEALLMYDNDTDKAIAHFLNSSS